MRNDHETTMSPAGGAIRPGTSPPTARKHSGDEDDHHTEHGQDSASDVRARLIGDLAARREARSRARAAAMLRERRAPAEHQYDGALRRRAAAARALRPIRPGASGDLARFDPWIDRDGAA